MNKKSLYTYILLILILTTASVVTIFLPQGFINNFNYELPAGEITIAFVNALIMIVIYGGLGYIGLKLAVKLNLPELWDKKVNNKERFYIPAIIGIIAGILIIIFDYVFSFFNVIGKLIHPPFPTSIFASLTAGIGEEIIFRLFFITFWTWIFSKIIFKGKHQNKIYWTVSVFSAILFALAHLPSIMFLIGANSLKELSTILIIELLILNSIISFPAAYYFKKYGILAAIGIHFWADIIWHVIYGLL